MEDIFKALVETNIPTLLTISGIVLLFLALAGRFGAYIEIKEERQRITLIAGVLLLIAGIGLHVFPTALEEDDRPVARGPSGDAHSENTAQPTIFWIQAGSFRTPGRADDFSQTLSNRLNRDPSVPALEVQVFSSSVTGCVFDRVVVIPTEPGDNEELEEDLNRVKVIVSDALLRPREDVLNSQSECQ